MNTGSYLANLARLTIGALTFALRKTRKPKPEAAVPSDRQIVIIPIGAPCAARGADEPSKPLLLFIWVLLDRRIMVYPAPNIKEMAHNAQCSAREAIPTETDPPVAN